MYASKLEGEKAVLLINYPVGTPEEVSYFRKKHLLRLFSDDQYRVAITKACIEVKYEPKCLFGNGVGNVMYIRKKTN